MKFEYLHNNLYITGEEPLVGKDIVQSHVDNEGELFLKRTNVPGIYFYGFKQAKESMGHPAGYVWSSRASVLNKTMNLTLLDATYKVDTSLRGCAIDLKLFEQLLNENGFEVNFTPTRNNSSDTVYTITQKKEVN